MVPKQVQSVSLGAQVPTPLGGLHTRPLQHAWLPPHDWPTSEQAGTARSGAWLKSGGRDDRSGGGEVPRSRGAPVRSGGFTPARSDGAPAMSRGAVDRSGAIAMSGGGAGAPQVPASWPRGTVQGSPAQQSESATQVWPTVPQLVPQRSWPLPSGTQGAPPQHSDEKAQIWPAAMQQPGVPS